MSELYHDDQETVEDVRDRSKRLDAVHIALDEARAEIDRLRAELERLHNFDALLAEKDTHLGWAEAKIEALREAGEALASYIGPAEVPAVARWREVAKT